MTSPVISVSNLHTWFNTSQGVVKAVDGISFAIEKAKTYALLGESGCGKSVTALSIMRLFADANFTKFTGTVNFNGSDLYDLPEYKMRQIRGKKISMIFQEPMSALNPVLTVKQQIMEVLDNVGNAENEIPDLLEAVGLSSPKKRLLQYPHELSGGMKQRVMIAMAIAAKPDLLIADEPTTALDVTTQMQILELLQSMQEQYQIAILLITHDLGIVANVADQAGIMYAGHLLEEAKCTELFQNPYHPYTNRLLDSLPDFSKRENELKVLEGEVPSLLSEFTGCRFASRCPYRKEKCKEQTDFMAITNNHKVRCHYPLLEKTRVEYTPQTTSAHTVGKMLTVKNLKVHFPIKRGLFKREVARVKAVDDISFDLYSGKTLSLVGESGCGKTTTANAILGLVKPLNGSINFLGRNLLNPDNLKKHRSDLQIIFQDPYSSMNPRMMVRDIISEGALSLGVWSRSDDIESQIKSLLKSVGLDSNILNRYPHEFSGGQRQRIAIARALAVSPSLLICDEPTSALDVSVQAQVLNLLRQLQIEKNLSFLFITHNLSVVAWLSDEIAVMYLGKIVEFGKTADILHNPRHPYTRDLIKSIPKIDEKTESKTVIKGELPSALEPPAGCPYHLRCAQMSSICQKNYPQIRKTSKRHYYYCHLD